MAAISFTTTAVERRIATKTLLAIELALIKDGGNLYRSLLRDTIAKAEDVYKESKDEFRTHLGASQIGRECNKELWYQFRWATTREDREEWHKDKHDGPPCTKCRAIKARMIRLLNRGHLEEARVIALLQMIGCEVWTQDANGKQFVVSMHGGHFGGSSDSVVRGIPDLPDEPILAEMKTHKDDSYSKVVNHGLREAKPDHYTQMQIYMGGMQLRYGIYIAVNKDNDDVYIEIIEFNPEFFAFHTARGGKIVQLGTPPKGISDNAGWFKCKFCNARPVCHKIPDVNGVVPTALKNCRTCVHSNPVDGGWVCQQPERVWQHGGETIDLSKEDQLAGCEQYTPIPGM